MLNWCETPTSPSYQPGLLDYETPSALALAQQVRGLVNKATAGHWSPRAAEREIREEIMELQTTMMSQGGSEAQDTHRLAELTRNLQVTLYMSQYLYQYLYLKQYLYLYL